MLKMLTVDKAGVTRCKPLKTVTRLRERGLQRLQHACAGILSGIGARTTEGRGSQRGDAETISASITQPGGINSGTAGTKS